MCFREKTIRKFERLWGVDRPEFNKEGGTIKRKYNNNGNETLHKRMYFQKHSRNKNDVGRST